MIAANPTQSESSKDLLPVKSPAEVLNVDRDDLKNDRLQSGQPALRKRVSFELARFLITFSMGAAATVAWQLYGDVAREMVASSFPQLRRLTPPPPAEPAARNASKVITLVAPAAARSSPNQQLHTPISHDLDAVRRSIDRLSSSQEQMTRNVDRLTAGQAQITVEIAKLRAIGQYILYSNSEPRPPQTPTPGVTSRSPQRRTAR
jgi:hypothetical protein